MHRTNQPSATWRRGWRLSMSHVTSAGACQICQSSSDAEKKRRKKTLSFVSRNSTGSISFLFSVFFFSVVAEESVSCENPGIPNNGYQILSKRLYLPGESLTFVCYQGYELIGEVAIKCILGNPSFWSGPLPLCRGETSAEFGCFLYVWNETLPCFSFIFTFWIYCMNTMFLRLI